VAPVILNSQQGPALEVPPLLTIAFRSQPAHEFLTI